MIERIARPFEKVALVGLPGRNGRTWSSPRTASVRCRHRRRRSPEAGQARTWRCMRIFLGESGRRRVHHVGRLAISGTILPVGCFSAKAMMWRLQGASTSGEGQVDALDPVAPYGPAGIRWLPVWCGNDRSAGLGFALPRAALETRWGRSALDEEMGPRLHAHGGGAAPPCGPSSGAAPPPCAPGMRVVDVLSDPRRPILPMALLGGGASGRRRMPPGGIEARAGEARSAHCGCPARPLQTSPGPQGRRPDGDRGASPCADGSRRAAVRRDVAGHLGRSVRGVDARGPRSEEAEAGRGEPEGRRHARRPAGRR